MKAISIRVEVQTYGPKGTGCDVATHSLDARLKKGRIEVVAVHGAIFSKKKRCTLRRVA
jgi:hypothetical protein